MQTFWTPIMAFTVFMLAFGIGDIVSSKTKSIISSIIVGCTVFLVGYITDTIPKNALASTGLVTFFGTVGLALLVANLGTLMNLTELMREWKTVIIGLVGLVGLALISFTAGIAVFGREFALCAAAPISGGLVATVMTADAANAAGRPELAAFATLVCAFQLFLGLPICSFCLKKEAATLLHMKHTNTLPPLAFAGKEMNLRLIPAMPAWALSPSVIMAKLGIALLLGKLVSDLTLLEGAKAPVLHPFVAYLLVGVILTEIGFLDKHSFTKAQASGFMMAGIMILLPGNFASVTPASLGTMIVPLVGMLVIGAIGIAIFAILAGKVIKVSPYMATAIGLTALLAYPATQIVTEEVVRSLDVSSEDKEFVTSHLLPKMLVGGFVTVTIASVVFAGIVVPMIFV